ncbi:MAG: class I SAM-dependent methyltransferase [Verrucomicrobiota bacterium]
MELALYCPVCGYYETETDKIGRAGDFYTSVSVGSLFGELLGFQFSKWLNELSPGASSASAVQIIETGAYNGQLSQDILTGIKAFHPERFDALEYWIVEPSVTLQQKQRKLLAGFESKVNWVSQFSEVAAGRAKIDGIFFSNELLDAMPVRRIGWDAERRDWFEWGVSLEGEHFVWAKIRHPETPIQPPALPEELLQVLPNGFTTELGDAAIQWWQTAARRLNRGKLVAVDYGLKAEEFIAPERSQGTLRAYSKHRFGNDLLANPGEQDLTAHVNFTAIQAAGEAVGLKTDAFVSQSKFLVGVAEEMWKLPNAAQRWDAARLRQFQTLTHPEHLGRSFRVLVQSRSADGESSS